MLPCQSNSLNSWHQLFLVITLLVAWVVCFGLHWPFGIVVDLSFLLLLLATNINLIRTVGYPHLFFSSSSPSFVFNALVFDACVAQMLLDYCWKNSIILKVELQFFPLFSFSSNEFFFGLNLHSKLTDLMFRKKAA